MRRPVFPFVALVMCACNAIDGADQYKTGEASGDSASCPQSCVDTSGTCLGACAATRDSCKSTCGNPGQCNKCDSAYSSCTSACVTTCTDCGCTASACENAATDAGAG